jgi:hypothetical protein
MLGNWLAVCVMIAGKKQESYFKQALRIDVSGQFVMDFRKELLNA